ncbi:DUF4280 domain-containing protein [Chryseobacterium capnotolerans]|nr:DUF4280 domain-containing protein [Chryseobacterium capnotolerans]
MSRYLPQETHVVCSYQMNPSPGALLVDPKMWNRSVVYKSEKQPLLTEVDKVLKDDFECKSNWGQAAAWSFLVAGLALGLAVAFSICTFGVGAIVLGAVAVAATVLIASNSTKCNPNLVEWINPHSSVKFEGHKALTQKSFLKCSAGPGILTPFLDEAEAKAAAKNVAFRNWGRSQLNSCNQWPFRIRCGAFSWNCGCCCRWWIRCIGTRSFCRWKRSCGRNYRCLSYFSTHFYLGGAGNAGNIQW